MVDAPAGLPALMLALGGDQMRGALVDAADDGCGALLAVAEADITKVAQPELRERWRAVVALLRGVTRAEVSVSCHTAPRALGLALYDWVVCCFDLCGTLWRCHNQ